MQAATIEAPEAAVSAPKSTIYLARRAELRLVHTPVRPIYGPGGQKQTDTKGRALEFTDGRFDVPLEGEYRFGNGETIDADELREWLDRHPLNGDSAEGFWRVDPSAPAPSPVELQAIMDAAMSLDIETLRVTLRTEREGWGREAVISLAEKAVERVTRVLEEEAKAKAEAAAKAKTAPKTVGD